MFDGTAIVYCEGAFGTPDGKTANGLARYTARYRVLGVIDSTRAGRDAGEVLDGRPNGIPIVDGIEAALKASPQYFVIGLAPEGGGLPASARAAVKSAVEGRLRQAGRSNLRDAGLIAAR